jgi:hypothetical protein
MQHWLTCSNAFGRFQTALSFVMMQPINIITSKEMEALEVNNR